MSIKILDMLISHQNIECDICLDNLTGDNIILYTCCNSIYHSTCIHSHECQVCEEKNPLKINSELRLLLRLTEKYNLNIEKILTNIYHQNLSEARKIDNNLRISLPLPQYIKYFGGVFTPPECCRYADGHNDYNLYKKGENVLVDNYQFMRRWDNFSHGLFDEFIWPNNLFLSGLTLPALIGKKNYDFAYKSNVPIHFIIFGTRFNDIQTTIKLIITHLTAQLSEKINIKYAIRENYLYIKIEQIKRLIRLECYCTADVSAFNILTNYSLSGYEMCQSYFNGNTIKMTVKAMKAFSTQITYRNKNKTLSFHYNDAKYLKFQVNYNLIVQQALPTIFDNSINYEELETHTIMLEPVLTVEVSAKDKIMSYYRKLFDQVQQETNIRIEYLKIPESQKRKFLRLYLNYSNKKVKYNQISINKNDVVAFIKNVQANMMLN